MELIVTIVSLILLLVLVLCPVFILKRVNKSRFKYKFIVYLTIGILTTTIIALAFAWWSYTSNIILLKHYNAYVFNLDSNSYQVSFEKVLPQKI